MKQLITAGLMLIFLSANSQTLYKSVNGVKVEFSNEDYIQRAIDSGVNLKLVMRKYSYMLQKRRKEFQAMEQQKIQTQSDGIVQQTQAATQGQQQTLQMQHQFALEIIQAQMQADIQVEQVKAQLHTGQAITKSDLKKGEKAFETTLPIKQ